jgi:hypothetical protein
MKEFKFTFETSVKNKTQKVRECFAVLFIAAE